MWNRLWKWLVYRLKKNNQRRRVSLRETTSQVHRLSWIISCWVLQSFVSWVNTECCSSHGGTQADISWFKLQSAIESIEHFVCNERLLHQPSQQWLIKQCSHAWQSLGALWINCTPILAVRLEMPPNWGDGGPSLSGLVSVNHNPVVTSIAACIELIIRGF